MLVPRATRRRFLGRLTLASLACLALHAIALAGESVRIAPRPEWVDELPIEDRESKGALRGAVDHLLLDFQDDARGGDIASYVHAAKRVLNEQGVQYQSEVSIDFDPTCQSLTVHTVALVRGDERIDALAKQSFQVIQRESQLDRQVYDGTRTALLFIDGVRVGDIIELEYTIAGRSPLFEGRYFSSFMTQISVPVHHLRKRILWRDDRTLHRRGHGSDLEPQVRSADGASEIVWDLRNVEALAVESDIPSWYEAYPWIQLSEYSDWNEVARWGANLFALPETASDEIRAAAADLRTDPRDDTEELRRALRFVQSQVRYLSIALGESSHRPSQPEEVLERRYGDCKDKALLLVALLRELGIDARPALVNTDSLHAIGDWIASPAAFDHVIVRALASGVEWWVDPTMSHERGPLSEQSLLEYGRALVLDPATSELAVVERDAGAKSLTAIEKTFQVRLDGATSFLVETVYEGADANFLRSSLGWQTTQELTDRCRDFYLADYPSLTVEAPAEVIDHEDENRLVVHEKYSIPDFFGRHTKAGWAKFNAREIYEELRSPETTRRSTPVGLSHPRRVTCHTIALLPDQWEIAPETVRVHNASMHFQHQVSYSKNRLELCDDYNTLRDHVPAVECAAFAADVEKARGNLAYEISDPKVPAAASEKKEVFALIGAIVAAAIVGVCLLIVGIVAISRRTRPAGPSASAPLVPVAYREPRRGVWREGSTLVMDLQSTLPPRCIHCNGEESVRVERRFSWHTPWLYLLILAGILIYAIVATVLSKRARVEIPLCVAHQRRRNAMRASILALVVGGLASCVAGMQEAASGGFIVFGVLAVGVSLIVALSSRLRPERIDDHHIRLRGAGKPFLDSLSDDVQELKRAA